MRRQGRTLNRVKNVERKSPKFIQWKSMGQTNFFNYKTLTYKGLS